MAGSLLLLRWYRQDRWQRPSAAEGYLQPWKAALAIALIGTLSYLLVGMPLGITTSYAKIGAYIESAVLPNHLAGLAYFRAEPLDYRPPLGDLTLRGGAGPVLDGIAAIQFPLILGLILGAAWSAVMLREFRIHWRVPLRQCTSAVDRRRRHGGRCPHGTRLQCMAPARRTPDPGRAEHPVRARDGAWCLVG